MKVSELKMLSVLSDGGCKNNGNVNGSGITQAYGSFAVTAISKDGIREIGHHEHLEFPETKTSPEAEYRTLVAATLYVGQLMERMNWPDDIKIVFGVDAKLLVDQINGHAKVKAEHLKEYNLTIKGRLVALNATVTKVERQIVKDALGH